jgi:hypothetical protein
MEGTRSRKVRKAEKEENQSPSRGVIVGRPEKAAPEGISAIVV